MNKNMLYRSIPKVDVLLEDEAIQAMIEHYSRETVMEAIRTSGLSRFPVYQEDKVSTDYILGLSTLSVRKSYDISELGLSEGAVRGLVQVQSMCKSLTVCWNTGTSRN